MKTKSIQVHAIDMEAFMQLTEYGLKVVDLTSVLPFNALDEKLFVPLGLVGFESFPVCSVDVLVH